MKKMICVLFILIILSMTISCSAQDETEDTSPEVLGNTNMTMATNGMELSHDNMIYYSKPPQDVSAIAANEYELYKTQTGEEFQLVSSECAGVYLNDYNGEWLYYISLHDNNIYKIKYDGSENQKVSDEKCKSMRIRNGKIFFTKGEQSLKLCMMNIDGSSQKEIAKTDNPLFNIENGLIYYWKSDNNIYRCSINGKDETMVLENASTFFQVQNGIVYSTALRPEHFDSGSQNELIKSVEGGESEVIIPEMSTHFVVYKNKIYFIMADETEETYIYYSDIDGNNIEKFDMERINYRAFLSIANDCLIVEPASLNSEKLWFPLENS